MLDVRMVDICTRAFSLWQTYSVVALVAAGNKW